MDTMHHSPADIASQSDLFMQLKGDYTPADRLAIYHATQEKKLQRVQGPKPKGVYFNKTEFLEWIGTTRYAEYLTPKGGTMPAGTSENTASSPQPPSADGAHGDVGIKSGIQSEAEAAEGHASPDGSCKDSAVLVDIEVVEDHAAPRATSALVCINAAVDPVGHSSDEKDFHRLDDVVRAGYSVFVGVGLALREIRDRKLWRHGRFTSWGAYCSSYEGMSKRQANRQISSAKIAVHLSEVGPIGPTLPYAEAQVRPLARLTEQSEQAKAWCTAVERAGGGQPTGKLVAQVVAEMVGGGEAQPFPEPEPKPDISTIFNEILDAVRAGRSHNEIEGLLTALGKLIGVCQPSSSDQP